MDANINTEMNFVNSFKKLMKIKSIEKIKITDLSIEAKLSRQTFYRYFKDIDDLIYFIHIDNTYISHELAEKLGFSTNMLKYYLELMQDNKTFYKEVFSNCSYNLFVKKYLYMTKENIIKRFFPNTINDINKDFDLSFSLNFYVNGFTYTIIEWIKDDCLYKPDFLANSLYNSVPENLKPYISK